MCKPLIAVAKLTPQAAAAAVTSVVSDSVPPIDGSPPGSPIPGIFQARVLERDAIAFSNPTRGGPVCFQLTVPDNCSHIPPNIACY